jgi:hypothetical protein
VRISERIHFNDDYWRKEMERARRSSDDESELVLVGRTLQKWSHESVRRVFVASVVGIIKRGGSVKVLTLNPAGEAARAYSKASGQNLEAGARQFAIFLSRDILPQFSPEERRKLELRHTDDIQLPFTMFRSDAVLWISPYLSIANTNWNVAFALTPQSQLANHVLEDFRRIWEHHSVETVPDAPNHIAPVAGGPTSLGQGGTQ